MWKTVHALRMKIFGKTEMETRLANSISQLVLGSGNAKLPFAGQTAR